MADTGDPAIPPPPMKLPFPKTFEEFDLDKRVNYEAAINAYILIDELNEYWEWDEKLNKWMPTLSEGERKLQQSAYMSDEHDSNNDENDESGTKRKASDSPPAMQAPTKKAKNPESDKRNTAIYVTSIPKDADFEEIEWVFRRYGLIAESADTGQKRIKLYEDQQGNFNGEALIIYFRPESVQLAIQMLDDSQFRSGSGAANMRVTEADTSFKKYKEDDKEAPKAKDGTTLVKPKKQVVQKQVQDMNDRLADWSSDEDRDPSVLLRTNPRYDKVVIMYNMFTLDMLEADPDEAGDIVAEVRDGCEEFGKVMDVTLFDKDPRGVITIRYANPSSAQLCVKKNNGRVFDGRRVVAILATGGERFRKSGEGKDSEEKRLDDFGDWLEKE